MQKMDFNWMAGESIKNLSNLKILKIDKMQGTK